MLQRQYPPPIPSIRAPAAKPKLPTPNITNSDFSARAIFAALELEIVRQSIGRRRRRGGIGWRGGIREAAITWPTLESARRGRLGGVGAIHLESSGIQVSGRPLTSLEVLAWLGLGDPPDSRSQLGRVFTYGRLCWLIFYRADMSLCLPTVLYDTTRAHAQVAGSTNERPAAAPGLCSPIPRTLQ
jgi:hypothetical protein